MTGPLPGYIGRFAPSPTGPLHEGSLAAALASWLDARAHAGRWLVRIEDVDTPRCVAGAGEFILQQLAACGLVPDAPPVWQSTRTALYSQALERLVAKGNAYPCACSRKDIEDAHAARGHARERHAALPYPGTCRQGLRGRAARSWRFRVQRSEEKQAPALDHQAPKATVLIANTCVQWHDRRLGPQQQDVASAVGDFVLRRADGLWAYQLAVVVDDANQGVTHVVRGEDLADNTPRQILLQQALDVATPAYLHTPLVRGRDGEKLSKQNGAPVLDLADPVQALAQAAHALGLAPGPVAPGGNVRDALQGWVSAWRRNYNVAP
jgi:glutamyl-Q tRNA(Asp) synthetase